MNDQDKGLNWLVTFFTASDPQHFLQCDTCQAMACGEPFLQCKGWGPGKPLDLSNPQRSTFSC